VKKKKCEDEMTSKLKDLKITPKKRSKETNPLKIFETLTPRGTVENIWDPQSEGLRSWDAVRGKKTSSSHANRVAIDPTGKFILLEKVRTKLMSVPAPLKIALITRGKLASNYTVLADEGWSLPRFRTGNAAPETFDSIDDVLGALVQES
jgi:hypothetical protein